MTDNDTEEAREEPDLLDIEPEEERTAEQLARALEAHPDAIAPGRNVDDLTRQARLFVLASSELSQDAFSRGRREVLELARGPASIGRVEPSRSRRLWFWAAAPVALSAAALLVLRLETSRSSESSPQQGARIPEPDAPWTQDASRLPPRDDLASVLEAQALVLATVPRTPARARAQRELDREMTGYRQALLARVESE